MISKIKRLNKDDRGVSPVIGVILMVAITVVMAAIVSSWSAGVKAPTRPTTVGLDISRDNTNITAVITAIDPISSAPISNMSFQYKYWNWSTGSGIYTINNTYNSSVDVGFTRSFDTNSTNPTQFIVMATFKDGSKRVLYSQET
ncbi:MAG: type IV pilin N-terminal domain-containing protein [Candidatus Methanoperedens sp.]|nr:type IV pilin N-terminal domain-containing protein [Candidatus Methanoperedens sp.]MCE8429395.1 type IV pilin N-terminal domain-containing protein [Candidatus Methanoperedens sp.]